MGNSEHNFGKNKITLSEVLEQEIELYSFENSVISALISAERKYEEAQGRYEAILSSRTWRYTEKFRKIGSRVKSLMRKTTYGRAVIRILKATLR
jgi:hypothetical protein